MNTSIATPQTPTVQGPVSSKIISAATALREILNTCAMTAETNRTLKCALNELRDAALQASALEENLALPSDGGEAA